MGLLDEVVFFKYLSLTFGATAYASSAVLVAFMAGLAAGAAIVARATRSGRRPRRGGEAGTPAPLRDSRAIAAYGLLEIAVGVACAATPWLFAAVGRAYVPLSSGATSFAALQATRGLLAGAVVLAPTLAMGATLPLVARVAGTRVTLLYGANTAGGAVGSLLGTYVVIPGIGLAGSVRAGACVSVAIGLAAIALGRAWRRRTTPEEPAPPDAAAGASPGSPPAIGPMPAALAWAAAASGALVFVAEVVFVHLLALVDGTSVYVFGLVLAVFLVALSVGAAASTPLARRAPATALPLSMALSACGLALTLPIWDRLPGLFVVAGPHVTSWAGREAVRGVVAALAIGVPATCMGTTFPLVLQAVSDREDRAACTGRLTAINTVASVVGSIAGGFLLLPACGSQGALKAVALGYAACAVAMTIAMARGDVRRASRGVTWPTVAVAAAAIAIAPRWDLARLASGTNVYFAAQVEQGPVVWMNEDVHGGVVTVTQSRGLYTMWTNGKYQGDTGPQMAAQRGFADIPAAFVPAFGPALVVGLGTGVTLDALAAYPFARIDVAEISPGIVAAASRYFRSVNGGVLDDPRVHVLPEDGRNVLLVGAGTERPTVGSLGSSGGEAYDLITVELTSIWFAGAANLYNREFYETAARRLTEGGVLSQWIQLHHTTLRDIASQLATAHSVFPHTALFIRGDQGMLEMSLAPLRARDENDSDDGRAPAQARRELDDLVLPEDAIDAFIDDVCSAARVPHDEVVSTDDNLLLEYATPRNNVPSRPSIAEMSQSLRESVAARTRAR